MAEEKSKKSIVLADDSDDDEYASEKDSEQTELSLILDKLSLGPEKKKKTISPSAAVESFSWSAVTKLILVAALFNNVCRLISKSLD